MKIISLFDYSQNMIMPWATAGHDCLCIDIRHRSKTAGKLPNIKLSNQNISTIQELDADIIFAFPPCTHLCVSGAAHFKAKRENGLQEQGLNLVKHTWTLINQAKVFGLLENPIGILSTQWKKPNFYFNPCDYAGYFNPPKNLYTKKTCIWAFGSFIIPDKKYCYPILGSKMHTDFGGGAGNSRSNTPIGFAKAVYLANKGRTK